MSIVGNIWPTLLLAYLGLLFALVKAQASTENPFIWQLLAEYNLASSNQTKTYLPETSLKIYSQDFQTVFENKDRWGYNERLVMNFGDGCPGTTLEDVERLNGNWATSPSMMSQPSIALVERGGRCSPWSEKIATVQSLSDTYKLQVSGIVIYDNIEYNDTTYTPEATDDPSYPKWSSTLPDYRDIKHMTDNIIDIGSTFVAVYFVPRNYMNYLNETLMQKTLALNGTKQTYTQLKFFMSESSFASTTDPSATNSASSDPDGDSDAENERERRNYIIYSVTAAVVIILVFVIGRWCRAFAISRNASPMPQGNMLLQDVQDDVILFDQLQHVCPIVKYSDADMLNSTCAICLDDIEDDYYVRVLPCHHGYCTACIDVWLTKKSSLCPICKYDCRQALIEKGIISPAPATAPATAPTSAPAPVPSLPAEAQPAEVILMETVWVNNDNHTASRAEQQ